MAGLKVDELRAALIQLGETPPRGWTRAELMVRLEELTGEDMSKTMKTKHKNQSPAQALTKKLNAAAAKRKADLVEFCQTELRMSNIDAWTKTRIQMEGVKKILEITEGDFRDLVSFGLHGLLTYGDLYEQEKGYCRWVVNTARERKELSDFRLRRLARWIEQQDENELQTTPQETVGRPVLSLLQKSGYKEAQTTALSSSNKDERLDALTAVIKELSAEVQDLKDARQPARKKGKDVEPETGGETDASFTMIPQKTKSPGRSSAA
ncbi:unnamed protein product [Symbiodinium necroappetens]|uniref:SAP domain-containing protein n=1 Tax=Symbiodinium necroappetens TaxID=1628268 RepID=A0A813BXG6_9DINO|nr:unnamed protein product [Symbiodinium necroappetens]